LDTPVPFNIKMEKNFLASARLHEKVQQLIKY
jgi:2-oxoisovalerate dehydrogenase E1 component